jgi:DNA (cytosine-5)-methyltransferase 1
MAGKRKGTDDERYLWGEMLRAIQEIKPRFVIAENVFGITNIDGGLVFEQVCLDLEAEGYEVQPFIIPAASKNAPHRRDRCWFIAYSSGNANGLQTKRGLDMDGELLERRKREKATNGFNYIIKNAPDTNGNGFNQRNRNNEVNTSQGGFNALNDVDTITMHTNCTMREGQHIGQKREGKFNRSNSGNGINNFQNFPTQSPICGGDDGIPPKLDGITFSKWRAESIKGYGNAIVPQVAFELFKIIEEFNLEFKK